MGVPVGLVNVLILHKKTQLKWGYHMISHLQSILESDVTQIPKTNHLPSPVPWKWGASALLFGLGVVQERGWPEGQDWPDGHPEDSD